MNYCTVCNSDLIKINNFVNKCSRCLFLKSNLKPGVGRDIEGLTELRKKNFQEIIKIIKKIDSSNNNKIKILEIGSGGGYFIEECQKNNIQIIGSEPNEDEVNLLKKKFSYILKIKFPLHDIDIKKIEKYDYVVFNDVFEHLDDLNTVINQLKFFLKNNGKIIINLPSSDGIIFKFANILNKFGVKNIYNRLWQKDLSSPHISYFNSNNLTLLFKKHGFDLIYSNSLNTVSKNGNFKRLNSTIKNKFICFILTGFVLIFYYLQKILPKDVIFNIYRNKIK